MLRSQLWTSRCPHGKTTLLGTNGFVYQKKCKDCGEQFHFPNYLPNEGEQIMAAASVSKRGTKLITPIVPGRIATDLN